MIYSIDKFILTSRAYLLTLVFRSFQLCKVLEEYYRYVKHTQYLILSQMSEDIAGLSQQQLTQLIAAILPVVITTIQQPQAQQQQQQTPSTAAITGIVSSGVCITKLLFYFCNITKTFL